MMTTRFSKERTKKLSESSPNFTNRRRYAYTRGCQALPITRRCLRLVRQLKQALRALEYEQRHCSDCQEFLDGDDPAQPCCEIENQMAHLDTALCELQEQWDACHWESDLLPDLVDFVDEEDLLSSGE
jgi:hypothetical protein